MGVIFWQMKVKRTEVRKHLGIFAQHPPSDEAVGKWVHFLANIGLLNTHHKTQQRIKLMTF